ncbi:MAG: D-alanine--D-alanine ligase [bacterium]|nr:D-alanine--D-alanine ligase [bacterium]
MNVGVIFGGRSVEHKVSVASARTVSRALEDAGHRVVPLGIAPDGCWVHHDLASRALAGGLDDLPPVGAPVVSTFGHLLSVEVDVLFPLVHGTWGEDGTLQGLCEMLDLPYVGTGVLSSAAAMDKAVAKQLLQAAGLPVVDYEVISRGPWSEDPEDGLSRLGRFEPPIFVKPSVGGSSVGISKVPDKSCLRTAIDLALRFDDRVIVEAGIDGRELECAVLGYQELEASVLGEIVPGKDFYDYADKYLEDGAQLLAPADLDDGTAADLRAVAVDAFAALGGWGMARVDFLLEAPAPLAPVPGDGRFYINEVNTLPGFTSISMYPRLWELSGVPISALVDRLVEIAVERHRDRRRLDDGIKGWIAEVSSE